MGIYLGATELGGGASTPVGGLAYFIPPAGTTFTSGQEVYTNASDNTVWLLSGAQISSAGAGALDASQYADSQVTLFSDSQSSFTPSSNTKAGRGGSNFDGRNVIVFGYSGVNSSTDCWFSLFAPDGTVITSTTGISDSILDFSASLFYNSTHTFISNRWISNTATISLGIPSIKYVQTSTLTGLSAYQASASLNWTAPTGFGANFIACVTNAGTSNEKHWWSTMGGTSVTEHTFNSSATNGTTAWTTTGNTITIGAGLSIGKIQGDGNALYIHEGTNVHKYNATTRELIKKFAGFPAVLGTTVAESGLVLIPASSSDSGSLEYWFQTGSANSNMTHNLYIEADTLTAPHSGTPGNRTAITFKDLSPGSTFTATEASSGRVENDQNIYLWMRIA